VFHIECRDRKPANTRVQDATRTPRALPAGRRQGWLPCQGVQRRNRVLTGFPSGASSKAAAVLRPLEIEPLSLRGRALPLPCCLRLSLHSV